MKRFIFLLIAVFCLSPFFLASADARPRKHKIRHHYSAGYYCYPRGYQRPVVYHRAYYREPHRYRYYRGRAVTASIAAARYHSARHHYGYRGYRSPRVGIVIRH